MSSNQDRDRERAISEFFEQHYKCCPPERSRRKLIRGTMESKFIAALANQGLERSTVLDVGCGLGQLTRRLIQAGAASATAVDITPSNVATAKRAAEEEGLADQITFVVGNGATESFESHDVVVLDRVFCCYPYADELLANTLRATRAVYGFTMPRSDRLLRPYWQIKIGIENLWHALRGRAFRAYVHEVDELHRRLTEAGFERVHRDSHFGWLIAVYTQT